MGRRIPLMLGILASAASVTAQAAPPDELPTYTQAYEPQSVDERGMWMEADEIERKLRESPLVIRDEALNDYVRGVLCRTVGIERCKGVRIYILEIPAFNAYMLPNGTMAVWSGLLLRVRNEAELGAVLGHEFGHFELRHSLSAFKQRRSATDVLAWVSVLGGMANTNTNLVQLSLIGSIFRFSREQEQQADLQGLKYLAASPYPAQAAADIWKNAMAEADATAIGRKRKPQQHYAAGFFADHPTELKRAVYLAEAAAKLNHTGDPAAAGHQHAMANYLPRFLAAQIQLNDFGGTEYLLNQLASSNGWTGELLFAKGELYRQRGNPRDLVSAAQFYNEAIGAGYARSDARRNLGLALLRTGQVNEGKQQLAEYLKLSPGASDAKAIAALIAN
jgi:predicted Zn-dependent protease